MKIVVIILFFTATMAAIPAIFGISRAEYSSAGWELENSSPEKRFFMMIFSAGCFIAAVGCVRRWKMAWWIVTAGWVTLGVTGCVAGIVKATELRFLAAFVDLGIGLFMLWGLRKFWMPMRAKFRAPPLAA